jgi:hypothetical protein
MSVKRRRVTWALVIVLSAGSLAACSVSMTGGLFGLFVSLGLGAFVLLGASTQPSCTTTPCLSPLYEELDVTDEGDATSVSIGPCLSISLPQDVVEAEDIVVPEDDLAAGPEEDIGSQEPPIGPCLSAPPPLDDVEEAPEDDVVIGPCLSPAPPDTLEPEDDADAIEPPIGPCLSPMPPDISEPDDDADAIEPPIGPCLSPPAPDFPSPEESDAAVEEDVSKATATEPGSREAIIARLGARGVLPADVLARLSDREES